MKNLARGAATVLAAFLAFTMLNTAPAQADNSVGRVMNYPGNGTKCLTPEGNGTSNGTVLTFWDCTYSSLQTYYQEIGDDRLIHKASGKCVTPRGNAYNTNGAVLTLWDCGARNNTVQSIQMPARGYYASQARMKYSDKCFTGYGNGTSNGTWVTLWTCASPIPGTQNWGITS
ncbi:ricin-type beta-trefoil lectin domain protein [Streptomyces sp. P9(2023)]|uniref:RICIN domain-containing protein n=1 Tax=Streptomyces sp. P9(2023) TaxID=3064394 RepID=UPI0028F4314C|nr:ricin-type beta-trefoil lectin domain protein [Streptomyces sp. P9(2023)]MDT9691161.1 ricin-type beta-trefoil lectin domain protein [Streptomyces sp. P9(2023)]